MVSLKPNPPPSMAWADLDAQIQNAISDKSKPNSIIFDLENAVMWRSFRSSVRRRIPMMIRAVLVPWTPLNPQIKRFNLLYKSRASGNRSPYSFMTKGEIKDERLVRDEQRACKNNDIEIIVLGLWLDYSNLFQFSCTYLYFFKARNSFMTRSEIEDEGTCYRDCPRRECS